MRDLFDDNCFVELQNFIDGLTVWIKIEGYNPSGSIKIKTALSLIASGEADGSIRPHARIIESSSGNLGVALAIVCARRGYQFTCVVDVNTSASHIAAIKAFGAEVIMCDKVDAHGGFLASRIEIIHDMMRVDPELIWTNQYANPANPKAHYDWTAPAILANVPDVGFVFVGAGTTGTLMGCSRYMREHAPAVSVVAVDSVGSVTFGHQGARRYIPGLGTSRLPEIFDRALVGKVVMVPEVDTVRMCASVAKTYGLLLGGSSGTVLAGLVASRHDIPAGSKVVVICPDMGERYLDTVYNQLWTEQHFSSLRPAEEPRIISTGK